MSGAELDLAATAPLQIQVPQLNSVSFEQPRDTGTFKPYPNIEILSFFKLLLSMESSSQMLRCSGFRRL